MKITPYQNNKTNFTSISIVQVPIKAKDFKNLTTFTEIESTFRNSIPQVGAKLWFRSTHLMALRLDRRSSRRPFSVLEQPIFSNMMDEFVKIKLTNPAYKDCNLESLAIKVGVPIKRTLKKDFWSFNVYTKEDKRATFNCISGIELSDATEDSKLHAEIFVKAGLIDPALQELTRLMKENQILRAKFDKIAKGKHINIFEINDLSEMPEVLNKIDY